MNSKEHIIQNTQKYIELCNQGKTRKEIAHEMGVSTRTVYEYQARTGIVAIRADDYSEKLSLYKELCATGHTRSEIMDILHISQGTAINYLRATGVCPERSISGSGKLPKVNENFFEKIDSEEKAYILGFICADGYIDTTSRNIVIKISKKDEDVLEKIKKAMNCGNDIHEHVKQNMVSLNISSKYLVETLSRYGIVRNKTRSMPFPVLPDDMYSHFYRGHCDGDGCVHKRQVTVIIGSDEFFGGYVDYLQKRFNRKISHSIQRNSYQAVVFSRKDSDIVDWMYKDASIYLDRKKESYIHNWLNYAEKRRSRG